MNSIQFNDMIRVFENMKYIYKSKLGGGSKNKKANGNLLVFSAGLREPVYVLYLFF